jgi:hypothetical protein
MPRRQDVLVHGSGGFSDLLPGNQASEVLEGTIVRAFRILRKATSRQLSTLQVITETLAANPLPGATLVAAVAFFGIQFFLAVHGLTSQCDEAAFLLPPLMITVAIRTTRTTSQAMTAFQELKIEKKRPPPMIAGTPVRITIPNRHAQLILISSLIAQ